MVQVLGRKVIALCSYEVELVECDFFRNTIVFVLGKDRFLLQNSMVIMQ